MAIFVAIAIAIITLIAIIVVTYIGVIPKTFSNSSIFATVFGEYSLRLL